MKNGPLSKAEKFYIESHLNMDNLALSNILHVPQHLIEKTKVNYKRRQNKKKIIEEAKIESPPVAPAEEPKGYARKLFARDINNRYDYTISTPAASEMSDETRKNRKPKLNPTCIHKPLDD